MFKVNIHFIESLNAASKQMEQSIWESSKQNLWKAAFKKFDITSNFLKAVFHKLY